MEDDSSMLIVRQTFLDRARGSAGVSIDVGARSSAAARCASLPRH
jgi:hypothetical protein